MRISDWSSDVCSSDLVSEIAGPQSLRVSVVEPAPNAFGYGIVRFLSGANSGLERAILSSASDMIQLSEPPAFACAPGDAIELRQGCDKRFSTCRNRSEEHTSELQSLMRISYAVFCLKKKTNRKLMNTRH